MRNHYQLNHGSEKRINNQWLSKERNHRKIMKHQSVMAAKAACQSISMA